MRDARSSGGLKRLFGAKQIAEWNTRNDVLRMRRLGIQRGTPFNETQARARAPFRLPAGYRIEEDGSIGRQRPPRRPR